MWESFIFSDEWKLITKHIRDTCSVLEHIKIALLERQPKYRLSHFVWCSPGSITQLIEVYRHYLSNQDYLRMYLSTVSDYVPCLVIGRGTDLIQLAKRNNQHPLSVFGEISKREDSVRHYVAEYIQKNYHECNDSASEWLFFVRPCTFVLSKVEKVSIDGQIVQIKYYFDKVHNSNDFFIHVTLEDERDYWSSINGFGVVLTNSDVYYLRQSTLLQFYYMPGDVWTSIGKY